ncbi:unnamed protein product [Cercopithifilaria johnstoni]|uniref:Uncharacterized protein n=1 Tax=Cercopithifilaria johnstoni TaxID=2874296 RepID=A0A8J2LVI2_9BILA|nr:unnamed protein product [Cercopithifilaria johnstoni]
MTKQSNDVISQNDAILPSSTKGNKLRFSKISHGSSRLSHLLSKISRKDKKSDNYYIFAEPPFTSTPDMSGEEDGVEVSYVETESENNDDSEDVTPAAESAYTKSTPNRVICIDSTTTTVALSDYSSSSASGKTNIEEQMIRTGVTACLPSDQQVVRSDQQTVQLDQKVVQSDQQVVQSDQQVIQSVAETKGTTAVVNANFRSCLEKIRYIVTVTIYLFLAIFVLFWCLIIVKVLYDDFYNTQLKPSMVCGAVEVIDEWLSLDFSQMIQCKNNSNNFFEQLHHEAEMFISFLIAQFRFIPTIWSSLHWRTFIRLCEEWLQETVQNAKKILNEYYEIIRKNVAEKR